MSYDDKAFFLCLAGSRFWHTGAFEVKKEKNTENKANSLDVNISSDLLGVSEVQVSILDKSEFIF